MVRHRTIDFSSRQVDNESTQPARHLLWKRSLSTKPLIFSSVGLRRFASARYSSNRSAFGRTSKIARNMALVTQLPQCCCSWKQVAPYFHNVHAAVKEST